ncbi:hypothetical protein RIF29_20250 [Crotalaria pallida]|uniref:Uncharacterized protein n=1 Tax=Crotalaria pallida TaxID=3830 RepID=A0AAN9F0S4_CROPI
MHIYFQHLIDEDSDSEDDSCYEADSAEEIVSLSDDDVIEVTHPPIPKKKRTPRKSGQESDNDGHDDAEKTVPNTHVMLLIKGHFLGVYLTL